MMRAIPIVIAIALLLAVPAQAQINSPEPFAVEGEFLPIDFSGQATVISGAVDVEFESADGVFSFFDTQGLQVEDASRICWGSLRPLNFQGCVDEDDGPMTLIVQDGGTAAFSFAGRASGHAAADHALSSFVDAPDEDVNGLFINQTLLIPGNNTTVTFLDVPATLDIFGFFGSPPPPHVVAPALSDTIMLLMQDGALAHRFDGTDEYAFVWGKPTIGTFQTQASTIPFKNGTSATFTASDPADVPGDLHIGLFQTFLSQLQAANKEGTSQEPPDLSDAFGPISEILPEVLNGALIRFAPAPDGAEEFRQGLDFILFEEMHAQNQEGGLVYDGEAALQVQGGTVNGAAPLLGFFLFQLPWWGWLIWAVAIGMLIARIAVKPEKSHPLWDRFGWIGWIALAVVFVAVFLLWDWEMRTVWGTSVLSTDASGEAFWITVALQLGLLFFFLGYFFWPLSMIIKSSFLLGGQGRFMNLATPIALLITYFLGAFVMLAYLDLLLQFTLDTAANA